MARLLKKVADFLQRYKAFSRNAQAPWIGAASPYGLLHSSLRGPQLTMGCEFTGGARHVADEIVRLAEALPADGFRRARKFP
jgi:hypothetical protein